MFNFLASQHRQLPESRPCDDEEDDVMLKSSRLDAQQHVNKICEQYHVNIIHLNSIIIFFFLKMFLKSLLLTKAAFI